MEEREDMQTVLRSSLVALGLSALCAATAAAQNGDPEGGDVWMPPQDNTQQQQQQVNTQQQQPHQQNQQPWYQNGQSTTAPTRSVSQSPVNAVEEYDNHERVVHRFAVGWMGVNNVPIADLPDGPGSMPATPIPPGQPVPSGGGGPPQTGAGTAAVPAVTLGIRYWITELAGIDVGLGFGYAAGSVTSRAPCGASETCPTSDAFALALHGGVPLAFFHETHYSFILVPELNLGFSTGTIRPTSNPDNDFGQSGFLFEIGGRVGTEIHFGFINIPSLSLQATVGLYFRYRSASANPRGGTGFSTSIYDLQTSVRDGEPWDILTGSLSALYYF